jgi:Dual specificity phosphatase, catalytic domain
MNAAAHKLALLQKLAGKDKSPCQVLPGLFIGPIGAARNLKALRKRGITHIFNVSPIVPCYFRDNPEGAFTYHLVPIYDDASVDLLPHLEAAVEFIATGRKSGGVLVHCYAGQSRSASFVIAYLMAKEHMSLPEAWAAVRKARPCVQPNQGFLRQLAEYEQSVLLRNAVVKEEICEDESSAEEEVFPLCIEQ